MHIQIFVANVLRLIAEKDMTRQDLAKRSGVSNSFLSDLMNGKANPSLRIMESISDALAMPLPYLLEYSDQAPATGDSPLLPSNLPAGYERVTAVVTEFQAFQVKQWSERSAKVLAEARATLKRKRSKRRQL